MNEPLTITFANCPDLSLPQRVAELMAPAGYRVLLETTHDLRYYGDPGDTPVVIRCDCGEVRP